MRAASSPAAKRVQTKCVAALIAAAMDFMMNSHHPHAWTTPVDVRTAGCAMAMFRRQTAAANSTIRKGSAVGPTRWRGASMPAVGLGRVGWPPVGFGARQQARRGPQAYCTVTTLRIRSKSAYLLRVSLTVIATSGPPERCGAHGPPDGEHGPLAPLTVGHTSLNPASGPILS